ncbi:hypothetical protein D3C78_1253540 [compost metagenome]
MLRGEGGVLGDFLRGGAELVDGCGNTAGAARLLVGVMDRGIRGADDAQGHFVDLAGGRGHLTDRLVNAFDEAVERLAEAAEFVLGVNAQAAGQVAFTFGDVMHRPAHDVQRFHQHADQQAQQGDDDQHRNHRGNNRRGTQFAEHGEGKILVEHQRHIPVGRGHAVDLGEGDELLLTSLFSLLETAADLRGVLRVGFAEVFQYQLAVGVD